MLKRIGIEHVNKCIQKMPDFTLLMYIDQLRKLKDNQTVFETVLWNDVNELLDMMMNECIERFREFV